MLFSSSSSSLSSDRMSQGETAEKENVRESYNGRNTTCNERLLNEYAGFAVIRVGKMNKKGIRLAEMKIFVCGCRWRSFKMQNLVDDTKISPSPCHSMCVHFVNTQIIEKHFCDDAAVFNIPCTVEIVKLHRKILIEMANIYFNIDTCTMVHVACMLRQTGKLFSCSCTSSCNNLNKQTHKKVAETDHYRLRHEISIF